LMAIFFGASKPSHIIFSHPHYPNGLLVEQMVAMVAMVAMVISPVEHTLCHPHWPPCSLRPSVVSPFKANTSSCPGSRRLHGQKNQINLNDWWFTAWFSNLKMEQTITNLEISS
jgi:hypothetical protein